MKPYLKSIAIMSILYVNSAFAQNLVMSYYPEERVDVKTNSSNSTSDNQLSEDAAFVYEKVGQTLMDDQKLVVKKISKATGKKVWEKILPVNVFDRKTNTYFCDLEKTGTGFILFMKKENAKTKESYLTGQIYDENLRPYGEEEEITTTGYRDEGASMPLFYKISRDGNHFLTYPSYHFVNDFKNKPIKFTLIDEKLKVTYEKEIEFPQNQYFQLHTVKLEKNLSMKAVFLVSTNGKKNTDKIGTSEYWVINYNYPKSDLKTASISLDDRFKYFGNDLADMESQPNKLIISGQYHKTEKNKGYEGIFNFQYNTDLMQLENVQLIEYTQPLLQEMLDQKKPSKGKLLSSYSIQNQYVNASSDVTYILEETGTSISKSSAGGSTGAMDKTIYSHNTIVVLKTSSSGELIWYKIIKRSASDPYQTYLPTYSYEVNGHTILLFNTTAESAGNPDEETGYTFSPFENVLVAMVFDASGNMVKTDSFAPKVAKGMSCNMQTIRNIDERTVEVSFDKVSKTYKLESITRARLTLE
jgi:hypothetical protein